MVRKIILGNTGGGGGSNGGGGGGGVMCGTTPLPAGCKNCKKLRKGKCGGNSGGGGGGGGSGGKFHINYHDVGRDSCTFSNCDPDSVGVKIIFSL